jgi:uncharacterized protein YciI
MEKKYFLLKSRAYRQTFHLDMTDEERAIMQQHIAYWKDKTEKGICVVFGPVMEPSGNWGLGIVEVDNEEEAARLIDQDPAKIGGLMAYEIFPMKIGMIRK